MSVHIVCLGLLYSTCEYYYGHPEHTRSYLILEVGCCLFSTHIIDHLGIVL